MSVGIVDIAKKIDVSHTTVSRVLNNRNTAFVSAKTRERVLKAAREMGYRPNPMARALRGAKTDAVGLAVPGFFKHIDPVELAAHKAGYRMHMAAHHRNPDDFRRVLEDFLMHNVDGILVHSIVDGVGDILREVVGDKPVVLCSEEPVEGFDCFIDLRYQAMRLAISYLAALGHKRIGLLVNHTTPQMRWRVSGYRDEMAAQGLAVTDELLIEMPKDIPSASRGYMGLKAALADWSSASPTAIICTNDEVAAGALAAAAEAGLDVPSDLSVMGMMNLDGSAFTRVPLTTVGWDVVDLAMKGLRRLIDRIADPELEPCVTSDKPRIIERASVAPLKP